MVGKREREKIFGILSLCNFSALIEIQRAPPRPTRDQGPGLDIDSFIITVLHCTHKATEMFVINANNNLKNLMCPYELLSGGMLVLEGKI